MERLGLRVTKLVPKVVILHVPERVFSKCQKVTESPELRKVTKVTKVTFRPDSTFLKVPTQAKGSPHFLVQK